MVAIYKGIFVVLLLLLLLLVFSHSMFLAFAIYLYTSAVFILVKASYELYILCKEDK